MPMKQVYDLTGIGYGPANISLNICLREMKESGGHHYQVKFFEKKDSFVWHGGMLIPDTYLQVSFLKDLVTQRNPRSKYTFINFLHETGRLTKFINLSEFEPSRREFNEYLQWVAKDFEEDVEYYSDVQMVTPNIKEDGTVDSLTISITSSKTGKAETYITKNLSIAMGGKPNMPKMNRPDPRVAHCSSFMNSLELLQNRKNDRLRFAVVGAGQSAVEMILYLYNNFPNAEIYTIISGFAFQQADTSLFVNEVFINEHVDSYFFGNKKVQDELFSRKTNYAVTSQKDIEALYRIFYTESFFNEKRIHFSNFTKVSSIEVNDDSVSVQTHNLRTDEYGSEKYDHVFLGTGFTRNQLECFEPLNEYFSLHKGEIEVNRDYSAKTKEHFKPKIFIQGHSENQHGLTNTLLSVGAIRAGEIAQSLADNYDQAEMSVAGEKGSYSAI